MYPSGIGTSFIDPRRSNFTKSQTLGYNTGRNTTKDFAETTANVAPHPTDLLGTNLRRGKGLSFHKGIAQFDGFVAGNSLKDNSAIAPPGPGYAPPPSYKPRVGTAGSTRRDSYQREAEGNVSGMSSARLQSDRAPQASFRPGSARFEDQIEQMNSSRNPQGDQHSARSGRPPSSGRPSSGHGGWSSNRFRPHSAPTKRPEIKQEDLPTWARDQLFAPSWAKTVDNQKKRPSSARIRPPSGLPLSSIPKWISLDNKMLSFEAFFKEGVEESRQERFRVRRCVVNYFLEDDTIRISEPREENSGIPQGVIPEEAQSPSRRGGLRHVRITKCDAFTREFLERSGATVGDEEVPLDDVHLARSRPSSGRPSSAVSASASARAKTQWGADALSSYHGRQKNDMSEYIEARLGKCQDKKQLVTKYLDNDRKVLRFYCGWDDKSPDGVVEKRPFVLHFFLADDTVEVLEVNQPNSGRDPFPALLKRMKLPRGEGDPGVTAGASTSAPTYLEARDLRVGGVVTVFSRQLEINDCDEATAKWYREELGAEWAMRHKGRPSTAGSSRGGGSARPRSAVLVPPHNGFGAEEDSRQNCLSLHPKPPRVNVIRLLENKGKVLRFVGKLEHAVGFDVERVFTITYFLDTDELSIFEPPVKNSGRTGGKFMERCKVRRPGSSDYYSEADLYLGARIGVYSRRFVLVDADEFTIKYMEANPEVFPASDMARVAAKLPDVVDMEHVTQALRA
eukprot:CAMPEP_0181342122 /NCGR_PEP_ID=MMETSP1101-20121128/30821_1 /TAXON_ID=46948 /ORGANISM="Rhodomonas abbreviata, Strain Caron Lab Isolate" /LENGTH=735 /DNA_ID=CAMNT_0023453537 /DNA_START=211 /DNA_END=2413 /DNA_ORIENTATION=+